MNAAVAESLDPDSPAGIAAAERLNRVLAEIWANICARKAAARNPSGSTDLAPALSARSG